MKAQTPLGVEAQKFVNQGALVPDSIMIGLIQELKKQLGQKGMLLDGFPRTTAQALMLEKLAVEQAKSIVAIVIEVPFDVLEKRTTGRRTCPVCGEIYNVYFKPPKSNETCDRHPGVKLLIRPDDTAEKIRVRLETFEAETKPLLDYYAAGGRLYRVDGMKQPEDIYQEIEKIITGEVLLDTFQS